MNESVRKAIEEIRTRFVPQEFTVEEDLGGGVFIRFGPVPLGATYVQQETWMAAHLTAQIPYADVYPVFVRGDLTRVDQAALVVPVTGGHVFMGLSAVQVSRRSNGRDPLVETAALKFAKVMDWLNSQ